MTEFLFIFLSSLVVVTYILAGGGVGPDLKKIIRIKDFVFSTFFSSLLVIRFLLIPKHQWSMFDCHFWHLLGNVKLLEFLVLNKNATTYWGKIFNRWKTNTSFCKSNWELGAGSNNNNNNNNKSIKTANDNGTTKEGEEGRRQAWPDNKSRF